MTFDEVLKNRRSVRKYTTEQVEYKVIQEIIFAGMLAPTACNKQAYNFIYLDNNVHIQKIYENGAAYFLKNCNQAILVLYNHETDNIEYRDDIQSGGAIIENMLLKAASLNIGTCWICNLPRKRKLKKLFCIPSEFDPVALISLGYIEKKIKSEKKIKNISEVLHHNKFDNTKIIRKKNKIKFSIRKYLRWIYIRLPKTKLLINFAENFEKKFDD